MAFVSIELENLTELKTRVGNATDTTLARILGVNYPAIEGTVTYRWHNTSTAIADDYEIVCPNPRIGLAGRWYRIDNAQIPQVNTDWNATSGISQLLNKPILNITDWNTAYSWGDHNSVGYLTENSFSTLTNKSGNISQWSNDSNYLTSFSETDPTVPTYAKLLTSFSIIKSSTDPLYKNISYTPSNSEVITALGFTPYNSTNPNGYISTVPAQTFASITGKPTTISGYGITDFNSLGDARWSLLSHTHTFASLTSKPTTLIGYGITDAYPLSGNPSGFISSYTETDPTVPPYSKGLTSFSVIKSSTDPLYKSISYTPTSLEITTALGYTPYNSTNPSNYITLVQSRSGLSLTNTGTGASTYNGTTGVLNIPTPNVISDNTVTRTINSSTYTISTTKSATVKYNIKINCTATIGSASTGKVLFQYSIDSGTNWIDAGEVENSNTVTLAVILNSSTTQSGFIVWTVPANALCRLVPTSTGTTTITWIRGQESY